jgi:ribonuclease E
MSKNDSPAGSTGGPVTVPALDDLPEKMRVHALAKLIGHTSREVLAALTGLGHEARSVQSSIDRKVVEQVITALLPGAAEAPAAPVAEPEPDPVVAAEPELELALPVAEPAAVAAPPLAPLFAPPAPLFQPPQRPARGRRAAAAAAEPEPVDEAVAEAPPARRRRRARAEEPVEEPPAVVESVEDEAEEAEESPDEATDDESAESARRRRRRGRRGRGRGRGGDEGEDGEVGDEAADTADETEETDEAEDDESDAGESEGTRRRRRRRRRRGSGEDATDTAEDDPPGTVTRIRVPREAREESPDGDGVTSVRGSTRLEAKRQRRRDGRDAGRRRQPILSEAEFLARRESVERTMVVRERASRVEIGVLEDDVLVEHFVTGRDGGSLVGNIYLGRVQNVLPSMEAAFVDIGKGRNAVLYAGEVDWDAAGLGGKSRRIEQALSSGDSVLVQVTKDPIGHKGARLSTQISLAGRFLVYVPSGGAAGISRKLPDIERRRLKDMLRDIVPSEAGVIIRTASEGVSHEALERDVRRLQAQWEVVKTKSEQTGPGRPKAPTLLYEEPDLLIKVVRDQFNEDFSRLVIQGDDAWDTLYGYLSHVAPDLADRMHRHVGTQDVFGAYRIDEQLLKALDRKVWLPSGGTLVIDRTEAMTVVDVNTGKFTGSGGNLEETVTRNNLEAAEEIVRQLRLRDIGGIIVIDFIDMVLEANRDLVLRRLTECLARDRTRHQVAEVTSLGLVQMTRKRVGGGLLEHFSVPCEHCRGRGVVIDTEGIEHVETGGGQEQNGGRRSRGRGRRGDGESNGHQGNGRQSNGSSAADLAASTDHAAAVAATAAIAAAAARTVTQTGTVITEVFEEIVVAPVLRETADPVGSTVADAAAAESAAPVSAAPVESVVEASMANAPVAAAPVADAVATDAPAEATPAPRTRRRGRVTRTAGAPSVTEGDVPATAVVTVSGVGDVGAPAADAPAEVPAPVVVPQPEPTVTTRPRRARRTASRPAGPPVEGAEAGGDPV